MLDSIKDDLVLVRGTSRNYIIAKELRILLEDQVKKY
jgi:hypothetical protein